MLDTSGDITSTRRPQEKSRIPGHSWLERRRVAKVLCPQKAGLLIQLHGKGQVSPWRSPEQELPQALWASSPASPLLTKAGCLPLTTSTPGDEAGTWVSGKADGCSWDLMISLKSHSPAAFARPQEIMEADCSAVTSPPWRHAQWHPCRM